MLQSKRRFLEAHLLEASWYDSHAFRIRTSNLYATELFVCTRFAELSLPLSPRGDDLLQHVQQYLPADIRGKLLQTATLAFGSRWCARSKRSRVRVRALLGGTT